MMHEQQTIGPPRGQRGSRRRRRPAGLALPPGTVMAERAAGWLRAHLDRRGLDDYQVMCSNDLDLHDLDEHLDSLGGGTWEPAESFVPGGAQPVYFSGEKGQTPATPGVLHLRAFSAVVARWFWYENHHNTWRTLTLFAADSAERHGTLLEALREARRRTASVAWHYVSGGAWNDEKLLRDGAGLDDLVLADAVRGRLDAEVVGFFSERAAALYSKLRVPYRRGVLLYGPPGNGKTSIIRALAAKLPAVSGFVLRATGSMDDDDFTTVVQRWSAAAPAILVIEDLNWLFPNRVNLSTFLNLMDGLQTPRGAGLMMVASTNHPDALDPALNDRPGRFDVAMELPAPGAALRREFFRRALTRDSGAARDGAAADLLDEAMLAKLTGATGGLSFAHLREVIQAAGLAAIRAGREERDGEDLMRAADGVVRAHRAAGHGFPVDPEQPFGLARMRAGRGDMEGCL